MLKSLASAVLVGLLIGGQREAAGGSEHPGLRDFLLISLAAGICGVLGNPWLSAAALLSMGAIFAVFHYEQRQKRMGITTELAAIATFLLALLAASPQFELGSPIAIGATIVIVLFLQFKQRVQNFMRETISQQEFDGTLAFVATSLVIYPLLPPGSYGPYSFFSPRQVWMFVILISSISFAGYFLEKFLGEEKGLLYTSLLAGLASTTAATIHFARLSKEHPDNTLGFWRAFVTANTVQFPRTFLILALVDRGLAWACLWPLATMTAIGLLLTEVLRRWPHTPVHTLGMKSSNPFRIVPALRFGALFTAMIFVTKAATARLGPDAFYATSLLGGLIDVSTVIAPAADLLRAQRIAIPAAAAAVLLALASNALLKIAVAAFNGTAAFTIRVIATFLIWATAGSAAWWFVTPKI